VGGFAKLDEHEAWRGWLVSAARATFIDPDGHRFERDIVRHPGAVAVVAVDGTGSVTLVRQFRPAVGVELLEVPAGTRDVDGEEPVETARRELAEEAGLEADDFEELIRCFNSPGFCDQQTVVFLATGLTACRTGRTGTEERFMSVERVRLADLDALVADGTLVDETTVLALTLARGALARRG
jgi:ADP-ribose pyrophosphatase